MARLRLNTVLRVGVRTLLVAGFAGGAWLLSSAAAHAAAPAGDHTVRTTQAVVDPTLSLLDQVLVPQGHHPVRSAAVPVTRLPAPVRPASQAASVERSHRPADAGPVALSRLVSSAFELLRPLNGTTEGVSAPVTDLLSLVTGAPRVVGRGLPAVRTVLRPVGPAGAGTVEAAPATVDKAQHSTRIRPPAVTALPTAPAHGRPAVAGTHQVPYFPGRAPIPAYPSPASIGISTTASGSQHDAGAYAVVAAPVAAGHQADLERLRATQVAVRLLLAEAPTFAPD
jgi:hypothetical protein